uniref:Uncharacterized protein n=1 Tax=Trichogramma kaykai TaxID=54128 RepID=A0ABD2XA36_9HYME
MTQYILKTDCPNIILVFLRYKYRSRPHRHTQAYTYISYGLVNKSSSAGSIRACLCGLASRAPARSFVSTAHDALLRRLGRASRVRPRRDEPALAVDSFNDEIRAHSTFDNVSYIPRTRAGDTLPHKYI